MSRASAAIHGFNTGVIDPEKLTRIDLSKLRLAAEQQTNFIPVSTGKAFLRPGFEHIGESEVASDGWLYPFVRSTDEAVALLFTDLEMRMLVDGVPLARGSVSTTVTNGAFASFTGWTDASTGGGSASVSGGDLVLAAPNVGSKAVAYQQVTVAGGDVGDEHALRVVVTRGPVRFRVGSTSGDDDLVEEITLRDGSHSLAFTPSGNFWVQFSSTSSNAKYVASCTVEAAGTVVLPAPWSAADFGKIRVSQSIDVAFVACDGYQQRRIERRAEGRSWALVTYKIDDGPFKVSSTQEIKLTPSALNGNATLTASAPLFKSGHVGCLFRLFHTGQAVHRILAADDTYSDPIRVTGVYGSGLQNDRDWYYTITGTWVGTVSIEKSADAEDSGYHQWVAFTANSSGHLADNKDNSIFWYRMAFRPGDYTSGSATVTLDYDGGGDYGVCRILSVTNSTTATIEILRPFKSTNPTKTWRQGEWNDIDGWPTTVALYDGRLWWGRKDRFWGSISDAYESFDEAREGDSAPIARSIATGGINIVRSIMPLQRLLFLTNGGEASARSSSLDEPLTPSNLAIRDASTVGSNDTAAVRIDSRALFVDKSGTMIWELLFDGQSYDYSSERLSRLASTLFGSPVKQMAVARRPDTRVWVLLEDGTLRLCVYEPKQEVLAFIPVETDGTIGSICVLPEDTQDRLFIYVERDIGGSPTWVLEKMAYDSEAVPATRCKCLDSGVTGTNAPASATISGLSHLEGETVAVWADGDAVSGTFTVTSGAITVPAAVSSYVVGRPYTGRYKSARLAYGAAAGGALTHPQRVDEVGLILANYHRDGITYGPAFDMLDPLPVMSSQGVVAPKIATGVDGEWPYTFGGSWGVDARVCIQVRSPYPAHLLALVLSVNTTTR